MPNSPLCVSFNVSNTFIVDKSAVSVIVSNGLSQTDRNLHANQICEQMVKLTISYY